MKAPTWFMLFFLLLLSACDSSEPQGPEPDPTFNYNQDLIAFRSERDGQQEIYLITPDGSASVNITQNPAIDDDPAWSPDGSKIAFGTNREDGQFDIFIMNVDGTGLTRLTDNAADDTDPSWCENGTKIAFRSLRDGDSEIYIINVDGTNEERLTNHPETDNEPVCCTKSNKIAFFTNRTGNGEVWTMNTDGSDQKNASNNDTFDCSPGWSPDCGSLTIVSDRISGSNDIYLVPLNGDDPSLLAGGPSDEFQSSWSGDGTQVVFDSDRDGNWELYTINVDGTGLSRLTSNPSNDQLPVWRP